MKHYKSYKFFLDDWIREVLHKEINGFHLIKTKVRKSNMLHKLFFVISQSEKKKEEFVLLIANLKKKKKRKKKEEFTIFSSFRHRRQYCTLCIE